MPKVAFCHIVQLSFFLLTFQNTSARSHVHIAVSPTALQSQQKHASRRPLPYSTCFKGPYPLGRLFGPPMFLFLISSINNQSFEIAVDTMAPDPTWIRRSSVQKTLFIASSDLGFSGVSPFRTLELSQAPSFRLKSLLPTPNRPFCSPQTLCFCPRVIIHFSRTPVVRGPL
ncbi:hypothetical protein L596_008288 [Steinernema carpocapsae]|uniref:Secreted protein n=1 Tax=Steinernema carpocapsae TaxID=34508 RepID=A0A4U5PC41_STECR|nr:hypothetical protein L596_008288 [Steinernema carpocapsae]